MTESVHERNSAQRLTATSHPYPFHVISDHETEVSHPCDPLYSYFQYYWPIADSVELSLVISRSPLVSNNTHSTHLPPPRGARRLHEVLFSMPHLRGNRRVYTAATTLRCMQQAVYKRQHWSVYMGGSVSSLLVLH